MKKLSSIAFACFALVAASGIYVNAQTTSVENASTTAQDTHICVTGNDDGYCSVCGSSRCSRFRAKSGADPTTCKCGHSKRSHVDSY